MTTKTSASLNTSIHDWDLIDIVQACHAGLAQDSPYPSHVYLNQILNISFAYLTTKQKAEVETYLAEKKYLPPVNIEISK